LFANLKKNYIKKSKNSITVYFTAVSTLVLLKIMNNSKRQLLNFISENKLKNNDGLIVFNAAIYFAKEEKLQHVDSEIQVTALSAQMAVYIAEFFRVEYQQKHVYKTAEYDFIFLGGNILHVWLGPTLILTIIVK
jgi:hypothetical protein